MTDSAVNALVVVVIVVGMMGSGLFAGDIWLSKGGGFWIVFLAGAVFGPLGVLWAGFSRLGRDNCIACEQRVPVGALKCWACGSDLEEGSETSD